MLPRRSSPRSLSLFFPLCLSYSHNFFLSNRWRFSRRCRVIQVRSGDGSALLPPFVPDIAFVICSISGLPPLPFSESRRYALAAANINPRRNSPRSAADTPLRVPHSLPFVRVYPSPPRPGLNARNLWPRYLIFSTLSSKTLDAVGS